MTGRRATCCAMALIALATAVPADPRLATYLTDANETRFVALFDDVAMEIEGCTGGVAVRKVLGLASDVAEVQGTLSGLTAEFDLGTHPSLPCAETPLAAQTWAADAPVWADLLSGESYFLAAPGDPGPVYEIPDRCDALKEVLNLRARVQQDGVLQGLFAPEGRDIAARMDCGDADPDASGPGPGPAPAAETTLSLHTLPVFLSATSLGDTVYVLRGEGADGTAVTLPVWRMDGVEAPDLVIPGEAGQARERALKALVGIAADAPVTPLGAAEVQSVMQAVFVDLCTADCAGYAHRHGYFAVPGADLDLTFGAVGADSAGIDLLGRPWEGLSFGDTGRLELAGCEALSAALGMVPPAAADWSDLAEDALGADTGTQRLSCPVSGAGVCRRVLEEGTPLTPAHLVRGADCQEAHHLVLELPTVADAPAPLVLDAASFKAITIRPAQGVDEARLRVVPGVAQAVSVCILSRPSRLMDLRGGVAVHMERIVLSPAAGPVPAGTIGIDHHLGKLALDRVSVTGGADGALGTGLLSCAGEVYGSGLEVAAAQTAALAVQSRLLLSAAAGGTRRSRLTGGFVGLSMISGAEGRLDRTDVAAPNGMSVRGGELVGTRVALDGPPVALPTGDALRLAQDASVELMTSTVRGFRCVGHFLADTARAVLILPGNALDEGNTRTSCGAGRVTVI